MSRMNLSCLLCCLALMATSAATLGAPKAPALPAGVEVLSDLVYARPGGQALTLDLYRPVVRQGPLPTVVFIHGGGWKNGSKKVGRKFAWLASENFALVAISYRLTDEAQWPAQIDDCYAAVRWVRQHGREYGLANDRIGCWGTSAGGHLAALVGTRPFPGEATVSSRVQAVCDWFGPSELLTMPPNTVGNGRTEADVAASNGAKLLGATVYKVPKLAKDASALDQVTTDDPPFLIMHGEADPGVPLIQSQKLHARLKANGISSKLVILKGAKHGGKEFFAPEVRKQVVDFFREQLQP